MTGSRLAIAAACLWTLASPAAAQRTLVIQEFAAAIEVGTDGALRVTETIQPRFTGTWNGIFRTIPVEYRTPQGFSYDLDLNIESVTGGDGSALRFESSRERHYRKLKIWVPGAQDAVKTVVITYRVRHGLKFFEEHDELYWNVTGDEWEVPIERARAVVYLPAGVTGLRAYAFTGGYGSQEAAARTTIVGTNITVETTRVLNFREGVTVAVAWNPGVVARPTNAEKAAGFAFANLPLLIPVGVFGLMFGVWKRFGRDPKTLPVTVQYGPPGGMTPAEAGTLVDNRPDMRDITASIVDLAVRGFLRIEETTEPRFLGFGKRTGYLLKLLKPSTGWKGLRPHEEKLLHALFLRTERPDSSQPDASGVVDEVAISDLEDRFYTNLPEIRERIFSQLIDRGYYRRRPDKARVPFIIGGFATLLAGGWVCAALGAGTAGWLATVASAVIIFAFGLVMPARTVRGARAREGVLGFEEFLKRVDADKFERVARTPDMFERFLPYAMALGVERNWARAFEGIYTSQPDWYVGGTPGVFGTRMFASSLANLSSTAGSAMASSPRSSGGSGTGGGGFSGGGFGGGGGGGF
ncbi:MAG TPA: DUF2207 domain-containing protein [Vicinamibacterales bacterium]|nr:DUF2207 domain-containing protein [Vicinamibacterales bacterium]HPW20081.1 DUF2207 domain-containing protein [Vicinamibacterales bacterium]